MLMSTCPSAGEVDSVDCNDGGQAHVGGKQSAVSVECGQRAWEAGVGGAL